MIEDIISLLLLFEGQMPDADTNARVLSLAKNRSNWSGAHKLFDFVRQRNLAAIRTRDFARECQYCFEEVCLKSMYNETGPTARFDSDSPYWIAKNAFTLARVIGVPLNAVVDIMSPPLNRAAAGR